MQIHHVCFSRVSCHHVFSHFEMIRHGHPSRPMDRPCCPRLLGTPARGLLLRAPRPAQWVHVPCASPARLLRTPLVALARALICLARRGRGGRPCPHPPRSSWKRGQGGLRLRPHPPHIVARRGGLRYRSSPLGKP
jgi:hypothetical protein